MLAPMPLGRDPAGALRQALALHRAGHLARARQAYRSILAQVPRHPDARYLAGALASQVGRLDEAVAHFRVCLEVRPGHDDALLGLANALQAQGLSARAVDAYEQFLSRHPRHVQALSNLSAAHIALGRAEEARAACGQAVAADPGYAPAHNNLGVAHLGLRQYAAATTRFRRALCLGPGRRDALRGLGDARHASGAPADAVRYFARAMMVEPNDTDTLYALGEARRDAGDHLGALACWRALQDRRPDHDRAHAQIALLHFRRGDLETANAAIHEQVLRIRRPGAALDATAETFRMTGATKLRHDAEQWRYLAGAGVLPERFMALADEADRIAGTLSGTQIIDLSDIDPPATQALRDAFNRLHHLAPAPAQSGGALNPSLPAGEIQSAYLHDGMLAARIDDLLTPQAHAALHRFCMTSTIWFQTKFAHEVGARLAEGLCCPLILQIARDLQAAMPAIFDGLSLRTVFGYMYYQDGGDGHLHADQGLVGDGRVVSLNYWLTPETANADPNGGGLWVWNKQAPTAYFRTPDDADRARMLEALVAEPDARRVRIPYAGNRAMLFRSDVLHKSDRMRFRAGLENRRISLTFIFGALE